MPITDMIKRKWSFQGKFYYSYAKGLNQVKYSIVQIFLYQYTESSLLIWQQNATNCQC